MIWWHRLVLRHRVEWLGEFGVTYQQAGCSCGRLWIRSQ